MSVIVAYEIPLGQVQAEIKAQEHGIEARLNRAVDRTLEFVEMYQIKSYTPSSNPAPPPGTRYRRTMNLQAASETERTGIKLPGISGVWRVNESKARYDQYVLGSRAEQAKIHRGRWKTRTETEAAAKEKMPSIIQEELSR